MILYVVYFRTMQDSPEVEIKCVTTSRKLAYAKFHEAKEDEEAWNEDDGSGNWAEACIKTFDGISDEVGRSSLLYVTVETTWSKRSLLDYIFWGLNFGQKSILGFERKSSFTKTRTLSLSMKTKPSRRVCISTTRALCPIITLVLNL